MKVLITGANSQLATALIAQARLANVSVITSVDESANGADDRHERALNKNEYSKAEIALLSGLFNGFTELVSPQISVLALTRQQLDITDASAVSLCFSVFMPDVVINCAAYNQVDMAEQDSEMAEAVNAFGPENLAVNCMKYNAKLVHFSSDYVFDGHTERCYSEKDMPLPLSVYGKSKLEGEKRIQQAMQPKLAGAEVKGAPLLKSESNNPDFYHLNSSTLKVNKSNLLIIRTSWLYSCYGHNFVNSMIQLQQTRSNLKVINDNVGSPTWADALAVTVWRSIQTHLVGVYHYAGAGTCSWFDFARTIQNQIGVGDEGEIDIRDQLHTSPLKTKHLAVPASKNPQCHLEPVSADAYQASIRGKGLPTAIRPAMSGLNCDSLRAALTRDCHNQNRDMLWQTWQQQLAGMLKQWHLRHSIDPDNQ